jgi:bacterioferritin
MLQSAIVLGLRAINLGPFLRQEAEEELRHVVFLCDQIVALGGVPRLGTGRHEESRDLKQMLESDLAHEREGLLEYRERAKQADLAGELGLKIELERLVAEETTHMHSLEKILRGWQQP